MKVIFPFNKKEGNGFEKDDLKMQIEWQRIMEGFSKAACICNK